MQATKDEHPTIHFRDQEKRDVLKTEQTKLEKRMFRKISSKAPARRRYFGRFDLVFRINIHDATLARFAICLIPLWRDMCKVKWWREVPPNWFVFNYERSF